MMAASQEADAGIQHIVLNYSFDRAEGTTITAFNSTTEPLLIGGISLLGFAKIGMAGFRSSGSGTVGQFEVFFSVTNPATNFKRMATNTFGNAQWAQLSAGSPLSGIGTRAPQTTDGNNAIASLSTLSRSNTFQAGISWQAPTTGGSEPVYTAGTVNGFVGFYFGSPASPLYGWAQIDLRFDSKGVLTGYTLIDLAFSEIPGLALDVGQTTLIPEPSSVATGLGLLALGAAGLRERRKRKSRNAD
jgi:hypothetical protein